MHFQKYLRTACRAGAPQAEALRLILNVHDARCQQARVFRPGLAAALCTLTFKSEHHTESRASSPERERSGEWAEERRGCRAGTFAGVFRLRLAHPTTMFGVIC